MSGRQTRAERAACPLARDSIRKIAEASGGCLRPVQLRRTDTATGETVSVMVPCGATLASICPSCAERAKTLRAAQCQEGWHLENEPDLSPAAPDETQEFWLTLRAEAQLRRDTAATAGQDATGYDVLIGELDTEITRAGIRGQVATSHSGSDGKQRARRSRSTRRRQDAAPLPVRKIAPRTTGRVYTAPDGKRFRPSMFLTLTCDSYGKVNPDGTPADPAAYDYTRAARDAIHFSALVDRFIQNLRRVLGYEAQYFGSVEPQQRLAPHIHLAVRGSVPRPLLRQVLAATYHQVWWPATEQVRFAGDQLPIWDEDSGDYTDPATGEALQTWDEALDAIGPADQPRHVARFGPRFDAQGVLAGSKDADRCIGYLTKYLTKQVADCHQPETDAQRTHADRLADALRYEPCSPTCANWLPPADQRPRQAGGTGAYPRRTARAHGCLHGPVPRCRAGPRAGRAALGELAGLKVGDRITVPGPGLRLSRAVLASGGGGSLYVDTLKNHRARTVPLVAELVPIIDRWAIGKKPKAWLFAAPGGGPLQESNWKRSVGWRAATVAADVPDVRVHDLRHTAASLWLAAGADPKVVQRVLGHATAAMTMDLYGHLLDASLWQAARLIGGTTGASELPQRSIRTESKPRPGTKNA